MDRYTRHENRASGTSEPDGVAGHRRARMEDATLTLTAVCLMGLLGSSGNLGLDSTLPLSSSCAIQGQILTFLSLDVLVRGMDWSL